MSQAEEHDVVYYFIDEAGDPVLFDRRVRGPFARGGEVDLRTKLQVAKVRRCVTPP